VQILELLIVLIACNGAPIVLARLLASRFADPLDGGRLAWDGRPWLGKSKTWRGVLASVCAGGVLGLVIDWGAGAGVIFAGCVMLGDLVSSFTKRRLNMVSSAKATFLDQVPESLLPLIYAVSALGYDATTAGLALVGFFVFETQISPLLFRLGIRARPH
jgi:hypothetical protein